MNKNRRKKPLKALKAIIICGAFFLIFCACLSIIIVRTGAQAAQLDAAATATLTQSTAADPTLVLDATPTDIIPTVIIPIPTPTPTPAPAPTATPKPAPTATPKPAPTPTPAPAPTPTSVIPITQPTPTVVGGGIIPPGTIPTTTNTPTANPSPTPKPQTTPTPSDSTPTAASTTTANTASSTDTTPDQNQNARSGMSGLIMPIAFGLASAVLLTAILGFFFLRKQKGGKQLPFSTFSQALAQTAQPVPWLNQSNANAAFAAPGGDHFNAANEQTLMQQQVASSTPPAAFGAAPMAIAMPSSTQKRKAVADTAKPVLYQSGFETIPYPSSSDLRPLTTPLPRQGGNFPQKNPVSTSDMNPLLLDNLDFATILAPDNGPNEAPLDAPAVTGKNPIAASSLIAPSIQDDPILETIMRQAQMGIYAIADKDPGDINDAASDAFLS